MHLLLALGLFITILLLTHYKPAWGLGIVLAFLPAYLIRGNLFGVPTTALELMVLGFLLSVLLNNPDWRKLKNLGKLNWAIGFFLLAAVTAVLFSPERMPALGQLKAFFIEPLLVFYATILIMSDARARHSVLKTLFAAAGIISLFGLIQHITYIWLPIRFWGTGTEPERITSLFEYPNALALYLGPLLALFGALVLRGYRLFQRTWLNWGILITMGSALLLTFSRGSWIALTLTAILLLVKNREGKKAAIVLILAIILSFSISPIRQRVMVGVSDPSTSAHSELLRTGANKIIESPYVGNGLSGFRATLTEQNFKGEILNYPHNIFLNFWLELGLLGLIAFCAIIFLAFERGRINHSPEAQAAIAFLLVIVLHGLVDVPYFKNDLSILFWFAMSLLYI